MELIVKQGQREGVVGDCPFSHRVMLTAVEEGLFEESTIRTVDLDAKPAWFLEASSTGSVPMLLLADGATVEGSGAICAWLSEKGTAKLRNQDDTSCECTASARAAVAKLFPSFVAYVKTLGQQDEASREERRAAMLEALQGIEAVLEARAGDVGASPGEGTEIFLCGRALTPLDLDLSPKLHHLAVVCTHYADNPLAGDAIFPSVSAYLDRMRSRDAWRQTQYDDALVIEGWRKHIEKEK